MKSFVFEAVGQNKQFEDIFWGNGKLPSIVYEFLIGGGAGGRELTNHWMLSKEINQQQHYLG